MRIVQVITIGHELYGAQKHVYDLANFFRQEGHDILVVVGSTGALTDACEASGIAWKQIPSLQRAIRPIQDIRACSELRSILNEFKPDIVASHSSKAGFVARWVCYRMGIPNTFTAHGWSFESGVPFARRIIYRTLERLAGKISCRIITVSNLGKALAQSHKIVPSHKLEMIYYGTADTGAQYEKVPTNIFTMSMVAGFREQKDHETLIKALVGLKDRDWKLYLLGDGPLQPKIESMVHEHGLADRVFFEGMVDNVPEYLAKTDLLVLITNWEGLPISTLEGLTFGLPVVASDVSGVREQVIDRYNGLTVARGDVQAVQAALAYMIDHREKLDEYGKNSRALYLNNFTDSMMNKKTLGLYETMIREAK